MATIESSGIGLRRASSSCFGPPPLLLQLVLASRCGADGRMEGEKLSWMGARWEGNHGGALVGRGGGEAAGDRPPGVGGADGDGSSKETGGTVRGSIEVESDRGVTTEELDHERIKATKNVPVVGRQQGTDAASPKTPFGDERQQQPSDPARSDTHASLPDNQPPLLQHIKVQHKQSPAPNDTRRLETYTIRKATQSDIPQFGDVERSAGEVFRMVGLDALADDDPMPQEVLRSYAAAGHVWVAVTGGVADKFVSNGNEDVEEGTTTQEKQEHHALGDVVVGFLACFPIAHHHYAGEESGVGAHEPEDTAHFHIAELSVHTAHQKRGLGRRLLANMFEEIERSPRVLASGYSLGLDQEEEGGKESGKCAGAREDEVEAGECTAAEIHRRRRGRRKVLVKGYSLTTYRHLAFNKRFYESVGFIELDADKIEELVGKRGRELWDEEQASILKKEMRCWMIRGL